MVLPEKDSTVKPGSFIRQDVLGSFVEKPVSCPMVAPALRGELPDQGVRVTV